MCSMSVGLSVCHSCVVDRSQENDGINLKFSIQILDKSESNSSIVSRVWTNQVKSIYLFKRSQNCKKGNFCKNVILKCQVLTEI